MVKTIKKTETEAEIEKRLAELRAELHKNQKPKKAEKPKPKKDYKFYSFGEALSICFNYKNFDSKDLCTKLYENIDKKNNHRFMSRCFAISALEKIYNCKIEL